MFMFFFCGRGKLGGDNNRLLRDESIELYLSEQRCFVDLPCVTFCFVTCQTFRTYTIFTLSPKLLRLKLKIRDKWLEREDNPRYLGITFDPRLTWKKHLEETQTKGVRRTALLKKLAGTTWGANQAVLKKTYVGYTRPAIEYGIAVWGTTAKSNFKEMARIQNQNLRIITGGTKSTPVKEMEAVTGLQSLEDRRDRKMLSQHAKFKCLSNHPMYKMTKTNPGSRLKRSNFLASARKLESSLDLSNLEMETLSDVVDACPPWRKSNLPIIRGSVKGIEKKGTETPATYVCMFRKCCKKTTLQIHGSGPTLMDLPKKPPQMEEEAYILNGQTGYHKECPYQQANTRQTTELKVKH